MNLEEEPKRNQLIRNLRNKYRLVVMNDDTFEEKYSVRLSKLKLFTAVGLVSIALIVFTTFIIAFTPLREYIPGYSSDVKTRRTVLQLAEEVDSLIKNANEKDQLLLNIKTVVKGGKHPEVLNSRSGSKPDPGKLRLTQSPEEAKFREEIEKQDRYDLSAQFNNSRLSEISTYYFFTPLKGKVTTTFNVAEHHFGIDVVAPKNEAVKATLDGTVIFAGWTSETGHVIQIQHLNNLISIYKHNAVLLKKEGESIKAGEAIAITGNSGELTTSPHLHFELWYDGKPIDPQELMVF